MLKKCSSKSVKLSLKSEILFKLPSTFIRIFAKIVAVLEKLK